MCCPKNTTCLPLAGKSTVICCPNGNSCGKIQPITCDIAEQDPVKNPNAPIKTTATGAKLPACGSNLCCPFGFTCSGDKTACNMDTDQSNPPAGSTSTPKSTTTTTPTPTTTSTATQKSLSSSSATTSAAATSTEANKSTDSSSSGPEKTSIIGGAVGGALALFLLAGVIFLCVRSRSKKSPSQRSPSRNGSSGSGPYGNMISGPILNPETSYRTDFIRKTPSLRSSFRRSIASRFSRTPQLPPQQHPRLSIPNPFDSPNSSGHSPRMSRSSLTSYDDRNARTGDIGARLAPIRQMKASSSYSRRISTQNIHHEPSSESINVFADPNTMKNPKIGDRGTTFSDLMEEASMGGVHRNGGYVPGSQRLHVPGTTPNL